MRLLYARVSDARQRNIGKQPRHQRHRAAGRFVVEPLSLHRLRSHSEGGETGPRRTGTGEQMKSSTTTKARIAATNLLPEVLVDEQELAAAVIGKSVTRLEDPPLVRGEG